MTSAHAIERAEHALRTGQSNLACIYMRRASVLVADDHEGSRRAIRRARLRAAAATPFGILSLTFEEIGHACQEGMFSLREALSIKHQYALAGPSKGGTHA